MENNYKTKDLAEAAALITRGFQLIDIEKFEGVCWFIFSSSNECNKISNEYYFGELYVDARSYNEALKRLKSMIFKR